VLFYSWADVIGYDAFLSGVEDAEVREETRKKTVELFRLVDRGGCRHQALVRCFDEEIEPCAASCDLCRGAGIEALVGAPSLLERGVRRGGATIASQNPELFERLRRLRKRLADADEVPAYIVFSDAVLRQMAASVPRTRAELRAVPGVGPVKLERYGDAFLEELGRG